MKMTNIVSPDKRFQVNEQKLVIRIE